MKTYEREDIVTFYFVVKEETKDTTIIRAWTDDKKLLDAYLELHACKKYHVKKIRRAMKDILPIINENNNDEIDVAYLITRGKEGAGLISLPLTMTEITFINDESHGFFSSHVNYQLLDDRVPYLKDRYQRILKNIGLDDVIKHVIYNRTSPFVQDVVLDQVLLFARSFPDDFDA
jgi:hypothetical protein|nr:MAG TPA: hypothetical protein [Caudoviricetes sp.]DAP16811.1 MAG TPA: hypothetical protein [Caudoviricetes sp.]